ERELQETDSVLGDPATVERFVVNACQRLGMPLTQRAETYKLTPELLSPEQRARLGLSDEQHIAFVNPPPPQTVYVGRNHPLVVRLAEYLLAAALTDDDNEADLLASRCAVVRTTQVERRTYVLLLR